ncbi:MAG: hypothetical protein NDJ89_14075 [Oligoflexia bacterium]|nr:hypothetical protein [Oligoflexia bacterium]
MSVKALSIRQRKLLLAATLLVALAGWLPLWRIELWAPQYPEGLLMQIGVSRISGNVEQINILNHYIGMKRIEPAGIPELRLMPWVLAFLVLVGGVAAALGRRALAIAWVVLLFAAGTVGMIDFYNWGYSYGHDLSPDAPIKVPGMSYQPPLIGHKALLNIHSYSYPDLGGYALFLGLTLAVLAIAPRACLERRRSSPGA